jgi:hypothetical protein
LLNGEKIANFDFSVRVGEEPRNKTVVGSREHFGNVVRQVVFLSGRRHDCDGRNKPSVGSHKPDYLLRISVGAGEQSVVVVGEIKGMADVDREFFLMKRLGRYSTLFRRFSLSRAGDSLHLVS